MQAWKSYVRREAARIWPAEILPVVDAPLRLSIVYLCDSSPADIDNIIKPIQDALVGLVFRDDFLVSDVDSHRRFLSDPIDLVELPPLLRLGPAAGQECVYVRVLDDIDSATVPDTLEKLPGWPRLSEKLKQVPSLIANGMSEPALLYLWSIFEAALRRRAIALHIPIERLPARAVLRHLYSLGEIPVDQIDLFQEFFEKHGRVARGRDEAIDPGYVQRLATAVAELIADWQENATAWVA